MAESYLAVAMQPSLKESGPGFELMTVMRSPQYLQMETTLILFLKVAHAGGANLGSFHFRLFSLSIAVPYTTQLLRPLLILFTLDTIFPQSWIELLRMWHPEQFNRGG